MAYYDVYDANDNLIASDVWIDDEKGGEPIPVNLYRIFLYILLIIGIVSTFITPLILFLNRDVFIEYGWLYIALMNLIIGIPILVSSISLLNVKKNENSSQDPYYSLAKEWVNNNIVEERNNESLNLGIINIESANKKELAVDSVYLKLKFQRGFALASNISYLIYPVAIFSILMEVFMGTQDSFFIFILNSNFLALLCIIFGIYKNYNTYRKNFSGNLVIQMIKTGVISFAIGMIIATVVSEILQIDGHFMFIFAVAFMNLCYLIDGNYICNKIKEKDNDGKRKFQISIPIILISTFIMFVIATVPVLIDGPIHDAVLAFDEGRSDDLSLPLIYWAICLIIDVVIIVILTIISNNKKQTDNN